MVANVTDMKTRDALLKLISSAVPRAVGTTVKVKVDLSNAQEYSLRYQA